MKRKKRKLLNILFAVIGVPFQSFYWLVMINGISTLVDYLMLNLTYETLLVRVFKQDRTHSNCFKLGILTNSSICKLLNDLK